MKHIMILLAVCLTMAACENDRPVYTDKAKIYLTGDPAQGAAAKAVKISFRFEDYTVQTYDINMVARIMVRPSATTAASRWRWLRPKTKTWSRPTCHPPIIQSAN